MSLIVSVHSFRGGTGKSNTTANIDAQMAARGLRVGVVDTDIQSPGIHVIFNLDEGAIKHSLNEYLWGKCKIEQTAHDVTAKLGGSVSGRVYLIPSSIKPGEITRILREGYDPEKMNEGFRDLIERVKLDVLLIDTHPGLNEETLLSLALSDVMVVILRPDQQDYQGTGVTVEVARKLSVPRLLMVINKVPQSFDRAQVRAQVEQTYKAEVAAILPHSDEMMTLASAGIFSLKYPSHPVTADYRTLVDKILA